MKKTMAAILAWIAVLWLGLGAVSRAEQEYVEKLINAEDIIAEFEHGKEKVKVIVNLLEPPGIFAAIDWNSQEKLTRLQTEVKGIQAPVLSALRKNEFELRHRFDNQTGFSGEVTLDGLFKLLNDPRVESVEPVYLMERQLAQGIALMNATAARQTYHGQGVSIAIVDDGIDYSHPKLGGGGFPNSKVIGGYDGGNHDSDPFPNPQDNHGTHCAGIAAGDLGNTDDYIGGVAYGAKLYALKVADNNGDIYNDSVIEALNWCVTHKNDDPEHPILVINLSIGYGRYYSVCDGTSSSWRNAADSAVTAGITVMAGSGNYGYCDSIALPACLGNVISVGAVYDAAIGIYLPCVEKESCVTKYPANDCSTGWYAIDETRADMVTSSSCTAPFLDTLAPSACAYTTDIIGYSIGDYTSCFGGTSASCAYATGAVACLQSASKAHTGRYLTPSEVRDILKSTGDDVTDSKVDITKPRVNLGLAINSLTGIECETIQIGTGTSDWDYPMHTNSEDSRTQVIYLASEVGRSGTITALALDVTKFPDQTMKNWTIRMKHTISSESSCAMSGGGWTVVYQNDETFSSTGWRTFEFQRPFEYNGRDNLLVDFSHNNSSSTKYGYGNCSYHSSWPESRCDFAYSDSQYGDPLNWSGTSQPIVRCGYNIPNVKLTFCRESPVATGIFEDTFPTTIINSTKWTAVEGATVDAAGINEPSGAYSLRLNGDDSVESKVIDLVFYTNATLTYYYQRTGGGSSPESGDDLIIEYWGGHYSSDVPAEPEPRRGPPMPPGPVLVPSSHYWIELARHPGDGPDMTSYQPNTIILPSRALHSNFSLRIRTSCSSMTDDWFVDDVKIEVTEAESLLSLR